MQGQMPKAEQSDPDAQIPVAHSPPAIYPKEEMAAKS
jgi:hypothetical protein